MFVLLGICLSMLVACGGEKVDDATSDKYIGKAEEIILLLNDGNFEAVTETLDSQMKAELTADRLKEIEPVIEQSGDYEEIKKSSVEKQDNMYITIIVANYTNENRTFTISFNEADEVVGLFVK